MRVIYNNIIPFKGFAAINLFGVLFVRKGVFVSPRMLNHEAIHTAQMKELGYILFYLLYFAEWLYRLIIYRDSHTAYRNVSFEKEAYAHQWDFQYLDNREKFAQYK